MRVILSSYPTDRNILKVQNYAISEWIIQKKKEIIARVLNLT